ncbi:MAG: amino acid permease [Gammaproteobacteria bacterium]|nr:amino acid permease [Gammaproteobacteria bacterium]
MYGLGNIIGAGIYVLIGKVAEVAGYLAPAAFLTAALVATLTAFSYGELASRYPYSAGVAVYMHAVFRASWLSVTAGLLVALGGVVSSAAIVRGFAAYLQALVAVDHVIAITLAVVIMAALAIWGIREALLFAAVLTILEIGGLLLIVWVGRGAFAALPAHLPAMIPTLDPGAWGMILLGGFLAFYAYIGFEDMVNIAEEVRNPNRNLPIGIITAFALASVLYLAVCLVGVLAVSPLELGRTDSPLALIYARITGRPPTAIAILGLLATLNGALIQIIMVSRIFYGMSRNHWLPRLFSEVNARTHTPVKSTLVVALVVWLLALFVPLVTLASATSFAILIVFALVNLALVLIKRRDPNPAGVPSIPVWIPALGSIVSAALFISRLVL